MSIVSSKKTSTALQAETDMNVVALMKNLPDLLKHF